MKNHFEKKKNSGTLINTPKSVGRAQLKVSLVQQKNAKKREIRSNV